MDPLETTECRFQREVGGRQSKVEFPCLSQCLRFPDGVVIWEKPGLSVERQHRAGQSWRLLCNISKAEYNKNRGRKTCQKRMTLISHVCTVFR